MRKALVYAALLMVPIAVAGIVYAGSGGFDGALHQAAIDGDADGARLSLRLGANPDVVRKPPSKCPPTPNGEHWSSEPSSALLEAVAHGHAEVAQLLLEAGADPEFAQEDQGTPLFAALGNGDLPLTKLLVDHGADPLAPHEYGSTPLRVAAEAGDVRLVSYLLDLGADPDQADFMGTTPLHATTRTLTYGHWEKIPVAPQLAVTRLLVAAGADVNAAGWRERTPVFGAAQRGWTPLLRELVAEGADLARVDKKGVTALHLAAASGSPESTSMLLDAIGPNAETNEGRTPLHDACGAGDIVTATLLLDAGADIDAMDAASGQPLAAAAGSGSVELLELLLSNGADIHGARPDGWTALHATVGSEGDAAARFLIESGAEVNAGDGLEPGTPLHQATARNNVEMCDLLVNSGARLEARDGRGWTPLHVAADMGATGQFDAARYLVAQGAQTNTVNAEGFTPAQLARHLGYPGVAEVLSQAL